MIVLKILGILVALFALCVLFTWICTLFVDMKKEYTKDSRFYRWLLNAWTDFAVFVLRIKIRKEGMEKVPEGRILLVQNHRSNFDPILTWHVLKNKNLSFISKKENFKIPFFGRIVHRLCFRAIDREDPREALKTIFNCSDLILSDTVSVAVYPEGTRNKDYENVVLLPFHNGVFKIAQRAKVPIVVTTIQGTENIHKNFPFRRSYIKFKVVDVITPEQIGKERTENIGTTVEKLMSDSLCG